jgi:hypothetical protein
MKTEQEIQTIINDYAKWLDEELNIGFAESNAKRIERTAEPVQNFIDACREIKRIDTEMMNDLKVSILEGTQRVKGEQRKDLYILDIDEHVRLVYC